MQISRKKEIIQKEIELKQNDYLLFCDYLEYQYMIYDAFLKEVLMRSHEVLNQTASKYASF
jgi:hypothetical protein